MSNDRTIDHTNSNDTACNDTDVAVIGVGCRFPDADSPAEFWRNIDAGLVSTRELTDAEMLAAGAPEEFLDSKDFVRFAARLSDAASFAADFFGYSAAEAEKIDPQQRLFLEVCWEALEFAGHPAHARDSVTGVFAGCHAGPYSARLLAAKAESDGWMAAFGDVGLHLGGLGDFLAARVAYKLGFRGPTVGVQAACASALHAVHYATLSLLSGECDIALAGGATVLEPDFGYPRGPAETLSEDGRCRSFDARATGTIYSSGVGVVVLRRLSDALADGDPVLAVVRGSAAGNHGADRLGFTVPSPVGVADVVSATLRVAGVDPRQVVYVEAHGSGTRLGDKIELRGLIDGMRTDATGFCGLGSVKANIGHTGPAAGIAGLINAVNVVRTGVLPPHPLLTGSRSSAELTSSPFFLSDRAVTRAEPDRHVLVTAIGFGGTNAAVVLAAPPAPTRPVAPVEDVVRLVLSARNQSELDMVSARLADELDRVEHAVADVAHTLRVGRTAFAHRRVVAEVPARLAAALRSPAPPTCLDGKVHFRRPPVLRLTGTVDPAVADRLAVAFGDDLTITRDLAPAGAFVITDPTPDAVDDVIHRAWLAGVSVDWAALADGRGHRVPLPTYPFQRGRYWALDRFSFTE